MTELSIIYHNASGKRNRMIIDLDEFFPCAKSWLEKLQRTVINRSDDPDKYTGQIKTYLNMLDLMAEKWLSDNSCGDGPMIGVDPKDWKKMQKNLKKIQACLEVIGGADGQYSDSDAGKEPARDQKQSGSVDLGRIQ